MDTRHITNNDNQNPGLQIPLKRISIEPSEELKKLERNEIGIKSGLKGSEIKKYVDSAIYKLIYANHKNVTLKAIGNACSKVLSIADILRRKIKNLSQIHKNYSRKYMAKYESDDGIIKKEKEFRLPCLDIELTLDKIDSGTIGYLPPLNEEELDEFHIDPLNPPYRQNYYRERGTGRGRGGFRGGRGRGNNNFRGRGRGYNYRGRGGQFRNNYNSDYVNEYHDNSYNNYNDRNNIDNYNDDYAPRQNYRGGRGRYYQGNSTNQYRGSIRGRGRGYNQRYENNEESYNNYQNQNTNYFNRDRY